MKKIFKGEKKERLDKYLQHELPISRSQIQKLIKSGEITVNNKEVTPHYFLVAGNVIEYRDETIKTKSEIKTFTPNPDVEFTVLDETEDYLIINKPSGLMVHPTEHMENDTLANGLIAKYPEIAIVGDDPIRPGIVHRLDKDVSGLMVITKNRESFEYFKHLFQGREIEKKYAALVYGEMEQPKGVIDLPIARSASGGKMATRSKEQKGKEAITEWEVKERFRNFSLLNVEIKTGRTHQIRTHMLAIGHGVVGDPLYIQKRVKEKIEVPRIFLHANHLKFKDLNGEWKEYNSPLPDDLQRILDPLSES